MAEATGAIGGPDLRRVRRWPQSNAARAQGNGAAPGSHARASPTPAPDAAGPEQTALVSPPFRPGAQAVATQASTRAEPWSPRRPSSEHSPGGASPSSATGPAGGRLPSPSRRRGPQPRPQSRGPWRRSAERRPFTPAAALPPATHPGPRSERRRLLTRARSSGRPTPTARPPVLLGGRAPGAVSDDGRRHAEILRRGWHAWVQVGHDFPPFRRSMLDELLRRHARP